jgi:hypothetical protein
MNPEDPYQRKFFSNLICELDGQLRLSFGASGDDAVGSWDKLTQRRLILPELSGQRVWSSCYETD